MLSHSFNKFVTRIILQKLPCTYVDEVVTKEVRETNKRNWILLYPNTKRLTTISFHFLKEKSKEVYFDPSEIQVFKDKMKSTVSKTGTTLEGKKQSCYFCSRC